MAKARDKTKIGPFGIKERERSGIKAGWYVDVPARLSPTGKRQRPNFSLKAEAIGEAKALLRAVQQDGVIRRNEPASVGFTLSETSERWMTVQLDRVQTHKKRLISIKTNAHRLSCLLSAMGGDDLSTIDEDRTVAYQKKRLAEGRAAATINSETRLLKQIVSWAFQKGMAARPLRVEPIPETKRKVVLPTIDEVAAILDHLPAKVKLLVHFLAETGCRKGEVFNLEWTDIDFAKNCISVCSKAEGWTAKTQHSERTIYVPATLTRLLSDARQTYLASLPEGAAPSPLVFVGRDGGRMWDFRKSLRTAITASGVQRNGAPMHITPHMFRKAHATWLAEQGVTDAILQPRLGHAPGSTVTHKVYVNIQNEAILSATVIDFEERRKRAI